MTIGSHIRAVGEEPAKSDAPSDECSSTLEASQTDIATDWDEEWPEERENPATYGWLLPASAILALIAWTAFFGWTIRDEVSDGSSPQDWISWISTWAVPALVILTVWLLAMRHSTTEANRFGDAARTLANESIILEKRLITINRELSLAREFLGVQSLELESLGRTAGERLSAHADHLASLVRDNGAQVEAIADVSQNAMENMAKLRDDLPVIANSSRDVSNQIGKAGLTAKGQVEELVAGFERLNQFGQASDRQVDALKTKIDAAMAVFDAQAVQMDDFMTSRFDGLVTKSEEFRAELDRREVEALSQMRLRADTATAEIATMRDTVDQHETGALEAMHVRLGALRDESTTISESIRNREDSALTIWRKQVEAMQERLQHAIDELQAIDERALEASNLKLTALVDEAEAVDARLTERNVLFTQQVDRRRTELQRSSDEAIEALAVQLASVDEAITTRREDQLALTTALSDQGNIIASQAEALNERIALLAEHGGVAEESLRTSAANLTERLSENRDTVADTNTAISELTEASVRLLELIQGAAQHSRVDLPEAMSLADERIGILSERVAEIRSMLIEANERGESLSEYALKTRDLSREAKVEIVFIDERLDNSSKNHAAHIETLREALSELGDHSTIVAENSRNQLTSAIAALENAAKSAVSQIGTGSSERIKTLADQLGEETASAIDRAVRERTTGAIEELENAAAQASDVSRDATVQLRDQLVKVDELTGNLEQRINNARERAEEQTDNDFARRMALIIESLNSNSIDIAKSLSSDVSDTAWASYLRGDRGIFTRRAVHLLDNNSAREIADIYNSDDDFSEHVSRYIHDFESMLRSMLSTRDGNAVSVTLLSSDMGKLYVALAQAIERLRD